jgi:hypothetical protein
LQGKSDGRDDIFALVITSYELLAQAEAVVQYDPGFPAKPLSQ